MQEASIENLDRKSPEVPIPHLLGHSFYTLTLPFVTLHP